MIRILFTAIAIIMVTPASMANDWKGKLDKKFFSHAGYYRFTGEQFIADKVWIRNKDYLNTTLSSESIIRLAKKASIRGEFYFSWKENRDSRLSLSSVSIGVVNKSINLKGLLDVGSDYFVSVDELMKYFDKRYSRATQPKRAENQHAKVNKNANR